MRVVVWKCAIVYRIQNKCRTVVNGDCRFRSEKLYYFVDNLRNITIFLELRNVTSQRSTFQATSSIRLLRGSLVQYLKGTQKKTSLVGYNGCFVSTAMIPILSHTLKRTMEILQKIWAVATPQPLFGNFSMTSQNRVCAIGGRPTNSSLRDKTGRW